MVLFLHSILTVPLFCVACWLTARIPEILCLLLLWLRNRQRGLSLHTPRYLLFALPPCFFFFFFPLRSTIFLLPYKISQLALNYWPVWSPMRLSHWCVVVHQQQHFFFFFFLKSRNMKMKTWSDLSCSESEVRGRVAFHFLPSNNRYILHGQKIVYE